MDPALRLLLKLQARSLARRITRGARTLKGGIFLALGLGVFALYLLPSLFAAGALPRTDPAAVRAVAPVALLVACLLTVLSAGGERAIVFTPAEVDFLFPGPFTRRQILLYRLIKSSAGATFSAAILAVVFLRHASGWWAAMSAMVLGMLFLQYLGVAILLAAQTLGERAHTWGRRLVVIAIVAVLAIPVVPIFLRGMSGGGVVELSRLVRESPAGGVILLPVEPFGYLLTAPRVFPDLLMWGALAIVINAVIVWVIFLLDADFLESAAARSQVLQARMARARKLGIAAPTGGKAGRSPPMLPYWRGAGPVMWRQVTAALRGSRGLLMVMLIVAMVAGPAVYGARASDSRAIVGTFVGALAWITVVVAGMVRFDFRGDVDHMEVLKSLPLSAPAVCAGQLAVPVLLLSVFHWLVIAAMLVARGSAGPVLAIAAALSLPFNAIVFQVENAIFLMFPVRTAPGAMDFQNFGRQTMFFLIKLVVILVAGGFAAVAGVGAWYLTRSFAAVGVAAFLVLGAAAGGLLPLLAWAYSRYDVSLDTPV